ncbi:MAG: tetratricopeptide repeat protein, partial [Verrucomicrobiales bacterium]
EELGLGEADYLEAGQRYLENFGESARAYERYCQLFLRHPQQANVETLLTLALRERDWPVVEAAGEMFLADAQGEYTEPYLLGMRSRTMMARGFRLLKAGRRAEALALLEAAHDLLPGNGMHADDLFPLLREHGLLELHDRLFAKSYARIKEVLAFFPRSANDKNTAAWLASRALLQLEEAEKLLSEALAEEPHNPAYLDTMAEIYFARGERDKAVAWSAKALEVERSDATLRGQNKRFRTAPLPKRGGKAPAPGEAAE